MRGVKKPLAYIYRQDNILYPIKLVHEVFGGHRPEMGRTTVFFLTKGKRGKAIFQWVKIFPPIVVAKARDCSPVSTSFPDTRHMYMVWHVHGTGKVE